MVTFVTFCVQLHTSDHVLAVTFVTLAQAHVWLLQAAMLVVLVLFVDPEVEFTALQQLQDR